MARKKLAAQFFIDPDGIVIERAKGNIPNDLSRFIYERDKWVCCVCGERVRRGGLYDHPFTDRPKAGSVDHILPVSRGGQHTKENLRLMCRSCNCSRGAI